MNVTGHCFTEITPSDMQKYEYLSESSGSPYQTDIVVSFNWKRSFQEHHLQAYDFIREFYRVLGLHGKDSITIQFEKFNKILRPTYSEGTTGVRLVLCVKDKPHIRLLLTELQRLVNYYRQTYKSKSSGSTRDLLARPRIVIRPPAD